MVSRPWWQRGHQVCSAQLRCIASNSGDARSMVCREIEPPARPFDPRPPEVEQPVFIVVAQSRLHLLCVVCETCMSVVTIGSGLLDTSQLLHMLAPIESGSQILRFLPLISSVLHQHTFSFRRENSHCKTIYTTIGSESNYNEPFNSTPRYPALLSLARRGSCHDP